MAGEGACIPVQWWHLLSLIPAGLTPSPLQTLLPRLRAALEKSFSYKQQREEQLYLQDQAAQAVQLLYTQVSGREVGEKAGWTGWARLVKQGVAARQKEFVL